MIYTPWFSPEQRPARPGLYLVKARATSDCWHMGYWNGRAWYAAASASTGVCTLYHALGGSVGARYWWRGLTERGAKALAFVSTTRGC